MNTATGGEQLAGRDPATILITDSGLGGLAVCADLEHRFRESGGSRSVRLVFGNALPEAGRGYNTMTDVRKKVEVFDAALSGMARWCSPDIILVACNTLSVLIPETRFARENPTPLIGIVETGVEMLGGRLQTDQRATGIIFGTETTIAAGTHRRLLGERGVDPSRVVQQACSGLAGMIEADAGSAEVRAAIRRFVAEAVGQLSGGPDTVVAGLFCTHYGYCARFFEEAFRDLGVQATIVDPNARMGDAFFTSGVRPRGANPAIRVEVVSRALISSEEVESISGLVEPVSPATARALRSYRRVEDLFVIPPHSPAV